MMVGGSILRVKECQPAVVARGVGEAIQGQSHGGRCFGEDGCGNGHFYWGVIPYYTGASPLTGD